MREDHGVALALQPLDLGKEVAPFQTVRLNGHLLPLSGPSTPRLFDRLIIWCRLVEIGRIGGAFLASEARDHLRILEARSFQRQGEASLDRLPRGIARQP